MLVVALVGSLLVRVAIVESEEPLVVVHWSNSHPLREDLLPRMAEQFNDADHETPSGQPIEIKIVRCDSAVQAEDLVGARHRRGRRSRVRRSRVSGPATRRS